VKDHLALTRALVDSVAAGNPAAQVEWVVVDTGSRDGTREYCARIGASVVDHPRRPFNYCAAVNAGARAATGDLWVIANNDLEFRSGGDLPRIAEAFARWPLLSVLSPCGAAPDDDLEFRLEVCGACWAVRPAAFRAWGGLPEEMTGYGYDELFTLSRCLHDGTALAMLPGWRVFHHGGRTFGEVGGNTSQAMRRNLSRLLGVLGARDLDAGGNRRHIVRKLSARQLNRAPARLAVPRARTEWLRQQGYGAAKAVCSARRLPAGAAWVWGAAESRDRRQWLPWLANELLLQPDAEIVGAHGWYALRGGSGSRLPGAADLDRLVWSARAVGPPPPVLPMPRLLRRPNLRAHAAALRHDWRHRGARLPADW